MADALCYPRQRTRGDCVGRIGYHIQDSAIPPAFEQLTKIGVLSKDCANAGGGYSDGLHPQFIDNVLQEKPSHTVPEPEDTPMYENGEGVNVE